MSQEKISEVLSRKLVTDAFPLDFLGENMITFIPPLIMNTFITQTLGLFGALLCSTLAFAGDASPLLSPDDPYAKLMKDAEPYQPTYSTFWERLENTWHSPHSFVSVPVRTYHSRDTYTKEQIDNYNEMPWGLGIGKWYRDQDNTRHQLILIGFADSHSKVQLLAGYTWQKDIFLNEAEILSIGYGCDFFFTAREDYYYIPFPGLTPELSLQYKKLALSASWVPWLGNNYGNVLLINVRWYF